MKVHLSKIDDRKSEPTYAVFLGHTGFSLRFDNKFIVVKMENENEIKKFKNGEPIPTPMFDTQIDLRTGEKTSIGELHDKGKLT